MRMCTPRVRGHRAIDSSSNWTNLAPKAVLQQIGRGARSSNPSEADEHRIHSSQA